MALRYEGLGRRYLGLVLWFNCGGGELEAAKERVVVVGAKDSRREKALKERLTG